MSEVETRKRHSLNNGYAEASLTEKLPWRGSVKYVLWLTSEKHGYHVTFILSSFGYKNCYVTPPNIIF